MKFRIAAIIAFAFIWFGCDLLATPAQTWELYLPPPSKGAIVGYDSRAPVSEWRRANDRAYYSRAECVSARSDMVGAWTGEARGYARAGASSFAVEIDRLRQGQCLPNNDPRLMIH
jgi:hypothetical protein